MRIRAVQCSEHNENHIRRKEEEKKKLHKLHWFPHTSTWQIEMRGREQDFNIDSYKISPRDSALIADLTTGGLGPIK